MSIQKINSNTLADGAALNSIPGGVNFRNRIINGDMRIAQRGTSANPTASGYYTVDRWSQGGGAALATIQPVVSQSTDAPPGFTNSYSYVNTNALTLTGTNGVFITQHIEGFNIADIGFGTVSAQTVTVSFWVKSSLTGKFPVRLSNSAGNRIYIATYTINAASTWEYKTVTIPGETTGTWLANNGRGIRLDFFLGTGPDLFGTPNVWSDTNAQGLSDMVQLTETAGATWQVTGVQLEKGTVATAFDRRPFGMELALCERYFLAYGGSVAVSQALASGVLTSTTAFQGYCGFPTEMRAAPTLTTVGSFNLRSAGSFDATVTGGSLGKESASIGATVSGATAGQGAVLRSQGNTLMDGVLLFSAEL